MKNRIIVLLIVFMISSCTNTPVASSTQLDLPTTTFIPTNTPDSTFTPSPTNTPSPTSTPPGGSSPKVCFYGRHYDESVFLYIGDLYSQQFDSIVEINTTNLRNSIMPIKWSPDGSQIIFVNGNEHGANSIFIYNLETKSISELVQLKRNEDLFDLYFAPNNGEIAYGSASVSDHNLKYHVVSLKSGLNEKIFLNPSKVFEKWGDSGLQTVPSTIQSWKTPISITGDMDQDQSLEAGKSHYQIYSWSPDNRSLVVVLGTHYGVLGNIGNRGVNEDQLSVYNDKANGFWKIVIVNPSDGSLLFSYHIPHEEFSIVDEYSLDIVWPNNH
jgi:hypothetical protein